MTSSPTRAPAYTTAPQHTVLRWPMTSGSSSASEAALDPRRSRGCLPRTAFDSTRQPSWSTTSLWMTAPASTLTPSPSWARAETNAPGATSAAIARPDGALRLLGALERLLEGLEHPDHPQPALGPGTRLLAVQDAVHEVLALQAQRLDVRYGRGDHPATAGDVLAVVAGVLVEALVVDGQLSLQRHVVEGGHPARAHHGEAAFLVGVEPAQVQVRAQTRGEAQKAEDHILDPSA